MDTMKDTKMQPAKDAVIEELRMLAQAALIGPDGISMRWLKLLKDFQEEANPSVILELLDRLEAAERKGEMLHRLLNAKQRDHAVIQEQNSALRAKIEQMERQEPAGTLHDDGCFVWRETAPHQSNYAGWKMVLYALPGAKGE